MRLRKEQQLLNEEHLQERLWSYKANAKRLVAFHFMAENRQSLILNPEILIFSAEFAHFLGHIFSSLKLYWSYAQIMRVTDPWFIWGIRIESSSFLKATSISLLLWGGHKGQFQVTNKPDKLGFNTKPTQETKSNKSRIRSNHFIEYLRTINVYLTW